MYGWTGCSRTSRTPPELDELAEVQDGDPVGDEPDRGDVVGDEEVGDLTLPLELDEPVEDLGLDGDVERARRLVEDDQLRVDGKRPGDREPLAASPGELVGVLVEAVVGKPDAREELLDLRWRVACARGSGLRPDRFPDDLPDAEAGVERTDGVLEDDLDVPAPALEPPGRARWVTSVPSNRILPAVGSWSRATSQPNVVLPEPDSPIRPSASPGAIVRETPSTACTARAGARVTTSPRLRVSGNHFWSPSVSRSGVASLTGGSGTSAGKKQALACGRGRRAGAAGATGSSGGTDARQTGCASGHRGWNAHPDGSRERFGTVPAIALSGPSDL